VGNSEKKSDTSFKETPDFSCCIVSAIAFFSVVCTLGGQLRNGRRVLLCKF
jgi:hypothetical protein